MKRFYSLDHKRSVLVTRAEWLRRTRLQDSYIRRKGLVPFRNRQNKPYALDADQYRQRITQVNRGRFYASNAYERMKRESTPSGQRRAERTFRADGFLQGQNLFPGEKFYTGPTAVVTDFRSLSAYIAQVHDLLGVIKKVDGRDPIIVRIQMSWGMVGEKERGMDSMRFVASSRGELSRVEQENDFRNTIAMSIGLSDAIAPGYAEQLRKLYLRRRKESEDVAGELIEGDAGATDQQSNFSFPPIEIQSVFAVTPL